MINLARPLTTVKRLARNLYFRKIRVSGRTFRLPLVVGLGVQHVDASEPWMIDVLCHLRDQIKGVFVDVGANVGQTLIKTMAVLDNPYIGFEPNPACACYLNMLVQANGLHNCTIVPAAVGGEVGVDRLALFSHRWTDATATLHPELRTMRAPVSYQHIAIVDLFETLRKLAIAEVAMIKVDVEGGELEVLTSAEAGIRKYRPIILIEVLTVSTEERYTRLDKINDIVTSWCYRFLRIEKEGGRLTGFKVLNRIASDENQKACDYLLVPSDRVEAVTNVKVAIQ